MIYKCKAEDFVDDCLQYGVTQITMETVGISLSVADALAEKGVIVTKVESRPRKEKKTLSDKKLYAEDYAEETNIGLLCKFDDVREHIKEFIEKICHNELFKKEVLSEAKEIFGKELIK